MSTATEHVELQIGGMTCASCAARIEKKLNKLDGVTATVNYATEKASVRVAGEVTPRNSSRSSRARDTPHSCRRPNRRPRRVRTIRRPRCARG